MLNQSKKIIGDLGAKAVKATKETVAEAEKAKERSWEATVRLTRDTQEYVGSLGDRVGETVVDGAKRTWESIEDAAHWTTVKTTETGKSLNTGAQKVIQQAGNGLENAARVAKEFDPFGARAKKNAVENYGKAAGEYVDTANRVQAGAERLHQLRSDRCATVILLVESYVNTLAHAPVEFQKSVGQLSLSFKSFERVQADLRREAEKLDWGAVGVAGTGALAGTGVAAFGPTAAMAIATTFGTASTGTAISTLSGAAATNAAVAWLGGGALTAGGGGMAAGNALLALAGPIGWSIGGAALLGAAVWANQKNGEVVKKAVEERLKVEKERCALERVEKELSEVIEFTRRHATGIEDQVSRLSRQAPNDYLQFGNEHKEVLAALINNVNSLSELIKRRVGAN